MHRDQAQAPLRMEGLVSLYRDTIYNNYITMDFSGRQLPQELRDYADEHILK